MNELYMCNRCGDVFTHTEKNKTGGVSWVADGKVFALCKKCLKALNDEYDRGTCKVNVHDVITQLNAKTGKRFRATNKTTLKLIKARANEGYTQEDFYRVIETKSAEWIGTEYEKYLNPETLFGNKFDKYLNQNAVKKETESRSSKWG